MKIKKLRYRSASTSLVITILQVLCGGSLSVTFTVFYTLFRVAESYTQRFPSASLIFLQLLFLSAVLLCRGIWNCMLYNRYRKLAKALLSKPGAVTVKQLSEETGRSPGDIFADIRHTINGRYWSGYGLTETTFVLVDAANNSGTILAGPDMIFQESTRRNHACIAFAAAVWILYLIHPGLYVWYDYAAAGFLSLIALVVSAAVLPKTVVVGQQVRTAEEYKPPEPAKTGVEETDDLLKEAQSHFSDLAALDRAINDDKLDKPVRELLDITRQIIDYVSKTPEKAKQIRQFVRYYLPTTIRLLKNYDELNRQPVKGENIRESIKKIEGIMDGILFTFRQQLDDLYRDKNIDISADIAVMENMINQDDVLSSKPE